jgi:predicted RNA-binding protein with TRAM domain
MPRRLPEKARHVQRKPRSFRGSRRLTSSKPLFQYASVKENQEIEVVIDDIGSRGDGIAKIQSCLIFVPNSEIDERVKVRIGTAREKFAIGEIILSQMEGSA